MKDLAPHDRPREKLDRLGVVALGDHELVALVLGNGTRHLDALALSTRLLAEVDGVLGLTRSSTSDLQRIRGIGRMRSAQLLAAVELGRRTLVRETAERPLVASPARLAAHLLPQYGAHPVEQFGVVLLDTRRRVIRVRILRAPTTSP
jgi:DNA repair protein RadC